jgi:hypothetical protein
VKAERIVPVVRDVVFLTVGSFVFVSEAMGEARWIPMVLGMVFAAGPAAVSAYWSGARIQGSGGSGSSPPPPSSSPLPLPSSPGGDTP